MLTDSPLSDARAHRFLQRADRLDLDDLPNGRAIELRVDVVDLAGRAGPVPRADLKVGTT